VRQDPARHGLTRSRWRLDDLARVVPAFAGYSRSGVAKALRRLGIRRKRGRLRLHSPDPAYAAKVARIARARGLVRRYPGRITLVYGDECSVYRQPTLAPVYAPIRQEPTVDLSHRANTRHRLCAALDIATGRLVHTAGSRMGVAPLCRFLRQLRAAYPDRYLFLVGDNWPVHAHPTVLAEAARQRIRLLWLPTYAPWENPIEKLWRLLKQELLHRHRRADDWAGLQAAIATRLDRFAAGSTDLLRYVGAWPDYAAACSD